MRLKHFRSSLLTLVLCTAIIVAGTLSFVSINAIKSSTDLATTKYRSAMNNGYNSEIKSEIQSVITVLQYEYDRYKAGLCTEDEAKYEAKEIVRAMRYKEDESGYFWIDDKEYTLVMHPILAQNEGNNRYELKDQNGVMIIQSIMKVCEESGGGYNEFYFTKSDGVTVAPKVAYSEMFEPWGWAVSTGNYVDDMTVEMAGTEEEIASEFNSMYMMLIVACLILMLVAFFVSIWFSTKISAPLIKMQVFAARLADGNLREPLEETERNELGKTARSLNIAQTNINDLVHEITDISNELKNTVQKYESDFNTMRECIYSVSTSINGIADNSNNQAGATVNANKSIEKIATAITVTNTKVETLDSSMKQLGRQSLDTLDELVEVNVHIKDDINKMSAQTDITNNSVQSIKIAADLIQQISTQTNLLSLNASIEAARAGEQGRGFAVVANEIGQLANQSAEAVRKIDHIIQELLGNSTKSMEIMHNMNSTVETQVQTLNNTQTIFKTLYTNIDSCIEIVDSIKKLTNAMDKQRDHVTEALTTLDNLAQSNVQTTDNTAGMTEELSATVTEASATVSALSSSVQSLISDVNKFTLR